ncbi:hypothetical protein NKH73_30990 [Mesorhizobium sp. M0938]|uniref:hypothetical protein n=1 Tax=unclassified Mesorhizobium TaxID=325217 RepID=UPI00333E06B5
MPRSPSCITSKASYLPVQLFLFRAGLFMDGQKRLDHAAMEDLDHPCCRPDIDLPTVEAVRHGIEEALELDMVIRRDPRKAAS